jgi:mRNA-degrading endonuclease YafQ of YafQ-DinJ toxin-antitoxin module
MSIVQSLLEYHSTDPFEIIEWSLLEDSQWSVGETKAYRKGMNKYQNDKRVMTALRGLIQFVVSQSRQPRISDYPPELYVHAVGPDRRLPKGTLWCHLRGQKIGLAFQVNYEEKMLELLGLGTHEDMGWR